MTVQRRKPASQRKEEIVETAIRLAGELGPDRLTTQHVAEEIGISQPAIFRHFPTKGDIWMAVAERISVFLDTNSEIQLGPDQSAADCLQDVIERHLSFIQDNPAIPAILFSRELHAENDQLRLRFVALMGNRQAVFAALFARGVEQEEFRSSLNAEDAAALLLSLIQGSAMRWSLNNRCFDLVREGGRLISLQIDGFRQPRQK